MVNIMDSSQFSNGRRRFLQQAVAAGAALPFLTTNAAAAMNRQADRLSVHIFSKHLQFLSYNDMADAAANMGFDGVDLTVRPRGHVLPERVADDLPRAVEAIRKVGLKHPSITTAIDDAADPVDQQIIRVAAKLGIEYFRMNWLRYPDQVAIGDAIGSFRQTIRDLANFSRDQGMKAVYQNHAGNMAGASLWELWMMIADADPDFFGVQFDIRHAVVEGGLSWTNGLRLIYPHIRLLTIKDFVWTQRNGKYVTQNVPLGEGMVDFKSFFAMLKSFGINVPVSLHFEYPLGGAEGGRDKITVDQKVVFEAMKKDLAWLHRTWEEA